MLYYCLHCKNRPVIDTSVGGLKCTHCATFRPQSLLELYVTEWERFVLALIRLDLVKQIFNNQTPKVQLFTVFITDLLYVHVLSLSRLSPDIRLSTDKNIETKDRGKRRQDRKDSSSNLVL